MIKTRYIIATLAVCAATISRAGTPVTYTKEDSIGIEKLLSRNHSSCLGYAKEFIGIPYVAHTLECNDKEQLVVNIRKLDCTTLVETAAALYITHKNGGRTFGDYCKTLENIRYRNGKANGYSSRLHYFSEWIDNNCRTGIAEDVGAQGGFPFTAKQKIDVHFMSQNPQYYRQLVNDKAMQNEIRKNENAISGKTCFYIPKDLLNLGKGKLTAVKDGDIIALVTSKDGLDISHVGIAAWENGKLHLLNASSLKHKVILDSQTLYEYQKKRGTQLGIRVIRLR